ncbi:GNAT family N-acetyltransferase [Arthrobacter sp. Hor0625]|uniref:GNAT family N-acetyltransferase n=1 Tax=Arthrobacter sp. Hor0625 TaxID=3457358 RepID=UPI00403EBCAD
MSLSSARELPAGKPYAGTRRATLADTGTAAATLAAAFRDYVWTRWVLPEANYEQRLLEAFKVDLETTVKYLGEVWMTDEGSSVAAWIQPQPTSIPKHDSDRREAVLRRVVGVNASSVQAAEDAIAARRPGSKYWYLATMGTAPERRRLGLGGAVLSPVLAQCDETGIPALLETSSEDNVRFYSQFGFEVTSELAPPHQAPYTWLMTRPPQGSSV